MQPTASKYRKIERAAGVTSFTLSKAVSQLKDMSYSRRAVLRAIVDRYPNVWPSVATLAADAGYGTTVTRQSLRELEEADIIQPEGDKRGGRQNAEQYTVNVARILKMAETQRVPLTLKRKPNARRCPSPTPSVAFIPETQRPTTLNPTPDVAEQRIEQRSKENREGEQRRQTRTPLSFSGNTNPQTSGQDKTPAEQLAAFTEMVTGGVQ